VSLRSHASRDKVADMKGILREPEIVTRNGKPVSVILPIKDYEELLERLEDAEDVAALKRVRSKPLQYRPLEDYLAKRKDKARV
jgi:PHD/YefM family antitoxin component YafN of YafNO toxin-antitoxin module